MVGTVAEIAAIPENDEVEVDVEIVVDSGDDGDSDEGVVRLDISPHDPATTDDGDDRIPAPVVSLFAEVIDSPDPTDPTSDHTSDHTADPDATTMLARTSADDLFARLRAARAESVAQRAVISARDGEPAMVGDTTSPDHPSVQSKAVPVERPTSTSSEVTIGDDSVFATTPAAPQATVAEADSPFARRDEALTPLIIAAARKLKRVLADEQNEVLHALRRKEPVRDLGSMLVAEREQAARYSSSIAAELVAAAAAGAVSMGMTASAARREAKKPAITATATDALLNDVVAPLRERLARCVSDADGDNAELASLVRLAYREWKNQRIDEHLDDVARAAFGRGALAGVAPGTRICWLLDPAGPACADAEDNALGGVIGAGEAFPTDHRCAPAHSGCRCMIAPAD